MKTLNFIQKANAKHENFYLYASAVYINSKTKVTITCPVHGDFDQTPNNHLTGYGCKKCAMDASSKKQSQSTSQFVEKADLIHGGRYTYSNVVYKNTATPVVITCSIHGDFIVSPSNHTHKTFPQGCPVCGVIVRKNKRLGSLEGFIAKASSTHNFLYTYNFAVYEGYHKKVKITCAIHGNFEQSPAHHLGGTGCPSCSRTGFNYEKPAILYYLSVNDGQAYKIGITNRTVDARFKPEDLGRIKTLRIFNFSTGKTARDVEQALLTKYKQYQYVGAPLLSSGNTELFTEDVFTYLGLPNAASKLDLQEALELHTLSHNASLDEINQILETLDEPTSPL